MISLTVTVAVAPPARADGGILGDIGQVTSYVGTVQQLYGLFNQYLLGHQPATLGQIEAAIAQSQTAIVNQIDALAAADGQQCAQTAVEQFESIGTFTQTSLQTYVMNTVDCVELIRTRIDVIADTGRAAIDKLGFALNIVGPIALFASADANEATDILTQDVITANQHLMTRLTPTCGPSILTPADLPGSGEGQVTGHGACFNYTVTPPPLVDGDVVYIPAGPGTAFDPWYIRGDSFPTDDLIIWGAHMVAWPAQGMDYSIAIKQVMAATSYPLANAALYQLLSPIAQPGSPLAAAASTTPYTSVEALRVNADSTISRNEVSPIDDVFSGWSGMDGQLQSVAEASNADSRLEMFGIDRVGNVFHRWQQAPNDNSSWSPWAQMTGQTLNSLAVARNHNGTLQLFGTTPSGQIITRNQILGGDQVVQLPTPMPAVNSWTDWKLVDGTLIQVAAANSGGTIELVGINAAGNVFSRHQSAPDATDPSVAGSWTSWHQLSGSLTSIAMLDGMRIVGANGSGAVWQTTMQGTNPELWSPWTQIPGPAITNLAAVEENTGPSQLDLFGTDASGQTYLNTNDGVTGDPWSGWVVVNFTPTAQVDATISYQSTAGLQWTLDWNGPHSSTWAIAPHTSPAITQETNGDYQAAFQGADGYLWVGEPTRTPQNTGLQMWPGTSPAITADIYGGWIVAYHSNTGYLRTLDSASMMQIPAAMSPGGSPSIAALSTGGYEIAFEGTDGYLWKSDTNGYANWTGNGLGVAPGTTPAIAANYNGGWKIAFHALGDDLWTIDNAGTPSERDTGLLIPPGTSSPSLTALPAGGYETAFEGPDGYLWKIDPNGYAGWAGNGLGVAPGTSPTIATYYNGGYQIAFHALGDHLWTIDDAGTPSERDTGLIVAPGSSPASPSDRALGPQILQ